VTYAELKKQIERVYEQNFEVYGPRRSGGSCTARGSLVAGTKRGTGDPSHDKADPPRLI
jgi:hypothetical protein